MSRPSCRNQEVNILVTLQLFNRQGDLKRRIHALVSWLHLNGNYFCEKILLLTVEILFFIYNSTKPNLHRLNVNGLNVSQIEEKKMLLKGSYSMAYIGTVLMDIGF